MAARAVRRKPGDRLLAKAKGRSASLRTANRRRYAEPEILSAPDPCHQCPRAARWVAQQMACAAFVGFVGGSTLGRWRKLNFVPSKELHSAVFAC